MDWWVHDAGISDFTMEEEVEVWWSRVSGWIQSQQILQSVDPEPKQPEQQFAAADLIQQQDNDP